MLGTSFVARRIIGAGLIAIASAKAWLCLRGAPNVALDLQLSSNRFTSANLPTNSLYSLSTLSLLWGAFYDSYNNTDSSPEVPDALGSVMADQKEGRRDFGDVFNVAWDREAGRPTLQAENFKIAKIQKNPDAPNQYLLNGAWGYLIWAKTTFPQCFLQRRRILEEYHNAKRNQTRREAAITGVQTLIDQMHGENGILAHEKNKKFCTMLFDVELTEHCLGAPSTPEADPTPGAQTPTGQPAEELAPENSHNKPEPEQFENGSKQTLDANGVMQALGDSMNQAVNRQLGPTSLCINSVHKLLTELSKIVTTNYRDAPQNWDRLVLFIAEANKKLELRSAEAMRAVRCLRTFILVDDVKAMGSAVLRSADVKKQVANSALDLAALLSANDFKAEDCFSKENVADQGE